MPRLVGYLALACLLLPAALPGCGGGSAAIEEAPATREPEWLEKDLDANSTKPTVFCTHRLVICPDFVRRAAKRSHGVELLMPRAEEVKALIAAHPSVVLVLSGHIHVHLELADPDVQALCLSTDALGEIPHEFRILRFYADRATTEFCRGGTAEGIETGQWTRRQGRLPKILKNSLAALREANLEKAQALHDAARSFAEAGSRGKAKDACRRLIETFPGTEPALSAARRLAELEGRSGD